jgi:hypothetical protein
MLNSSTGIIAKVIVTRLLAGQQCGKEKFSYLCHARGSTPGNFYRKNMPDILDTYHAKQSSGRKYDNICRQA